MRFFEVVLSGAALISAAFAVEFNSWPESVTAGEAITLTYSPKGVDTTIILRKGPSTDLDTLETITSTSTSGSFTWTVPSSLEDGDDYAFEIRQAGEDPNYTGQFSLSGGAASAVSSAYSTPESSSATAASSASSAAYSTADSTAASSVYSTAASPAYSTGVSTIMTSLVTAAPSASAPSASGSYPSHGANSTISTGSLSGTPTGSTPPIENTGAASSFGVNAAALFGAFGVFAYLA